MSPALAKLVADTRAQAGDELPLPSDDPELVARLMRRLFALEAENQALRSGASPADLALVKNLAVEFGHEATTAREIAARAEAAPVLRLSISAALGGGWSVRALGKRLAKLAGCGVRRVQAADSAGAVWCFDNFGEFGPPQTHSAP